MIFPGPLIQLNEVKKSGLKQSYCHFCLFGPRIIFEAMVIRKHS